MCACLHLRVSVGTGAWLGGRACAVGFWKEGKLCSVIGWACGASGLLHIPSGKGSTLPWVAFPLDAVLSFDLALFSETGVRFFLFWLR